MAPQCYCWTENIIFQVKDKHNLSPDSRSIILYLENRFGKQTDFTFSPCAVSGTKLTAKKKWHFRNNIYTKSIYPSLIFHKQPYFDLKSLAGIPRLIFEIVSIHIRPSFEHSGACMYTVHNWCTVNSGSRFW